MRLISEYWYLCGKYKFAIYKTVEYPFGWLFFFGTLLTEEEQEEIGLINIVFSNKFPSIVDKTMERFTP